MLPRHLAPRYPAPPGPVNRHRFFGTTSLLAIAG